MRGENRPRGGEKGRGEERRRSKEEEEGEGEQRRKGRGEKGRGEGRGLEKRGRERRREDEMETEKERQRKTKKRIKKKKKEKRKRDQKTNDAKHLIAFFGTRNTVSSHLSWNNGGITDRKAKREIFAWCPAQLRRWAIWRLGFSSHWLVPVTRLTYTHCIAEQVFLCACVCVSVSVCTVYRSE